MIILSCPKQLLAIAKFIKLIILIIRIVAPIVLIVATMLGYTSAVKSSDSDALQKESRVFVKRAIAVLVLLLLPTLVSIIVNAIAPNNGFNECFNEATLWSSKDKEAFDVPDPVKNLKCSLTLRKDGTTRVTLSGGAAGSTYSLSYDGNTKTTQKGDLSLNGVYEKVSVTVAGGSRSVTCKVDKVELYDPITPPANSVEVASASSDTLKVKIVRIDNYYLSYMWVKDPYKQFNKVQATNYGSGRETIAKMFDAAIAKEGSNKIMLATNASGFYVNGTWTPKTKSYNEKLNFTQEGGLVITDGKVIRNWYYDDAVDTMRNDTIYGILPNGYLAEYPNINDYTENGRKELFQKIIDSGIRNTITFRPTLIRKGKIVGWGNNSSTNKTTALCQVDRNNYILYSTPGGQKMENTVRQLIGYGCQTAVAFDGGGSVSLYFKDKTGGAQKIAGGSRENVEILYVTEG